MNCHGPYNGAKNVGADSPLTSLAACQALCIATVGCEAICITTQTWSDQLCGLRAEIWSSHCYGDGAHDTYVLAVPSPPPSLPKSPIPRMSPEQRASLLNARFRNARPSSDLSVVGLVCHQFDKLETAGAPWKSCNYHCDNSLSGQSLTGRLSTSIMYGGMRNRNDRKAVPLVSNDGGVIARPSLLNISCVYGIDGATVGLSGGPNGDGCPSYWCDPNAKREPNGYCGFWGAPPQAAWRAEDLARLIELHERVGAPYHAPGYHAGYNEAVVDGLTWNANLPNSVECFFELEGRGVEATSDRGRSQASYARDAHRRFLNEYGLTDREVPLLKFDPARFDAPFRAATSTPLSTIMDRFHTSPFGAWPEDGTLAWAGVLVHCIDGYEDHRQPWKPEHGYVSASLIFADMRVPGFGVPIFTCKDGGYIFRPGTKLVCGNAGDSGGGCHQFCPTATELGDVHSFSNPGDGCGGSWRPPDFGMYLQRVTAWTKANHRSSYNEIIVEGAGPHSPWTANLPDTIEAFFSVKGKDASGIRGHHSNFLRAYRLNAAQHPLLTLDPDNWERPLS